MTEQKNQLTFLLVEDNDDHAKIVSRCLSGLSHVKSVIRMHDGIDAQKFLSANGGGESVDNLPDLVLLDLNLPRMSGHELLSFIKSSAKLHSIPVVILSTSDSPHDISTAYALNANSYLVKPIDRVMFQDMLTDMCQYWANWNVCDHA